MTTSKRLEENGITRFTISDADLVADWGNPEAMKKHIDRIAANYRKEQMAEEEHFESIRNDD